ncbi:membrane-spanning 4-domains subfamily A member 4D-like [Spea bombifrons]|uniref:membrane-spanning 4-domains subfamily A member 4D-like n=1 Tax=Spea bombifrons TaxID=233779 RepID=UPI002349644E|nr:membrane-spanning 4-domains subfamily A member 4D-like [Spea bombifrons]
MASSQPTFVMVPQWTNNPAVQPMAFPTPTKPERVQVLYKGEPKALGATQLALAFLQIAFGTVLFFTVTYGIPISSYSGINFWGALFYIISGSLSVAVEKRPTPSMISGFLAMNIISAIISLAAACLFMTDMFVYYCYDYNGCYNNDYYTLEANRIICLVFLVIASLLQFCISVSLSAFGCKSVCRQSSLPSQVFVIQNDYRNPENNQIPVAGNPYPYLPQHNAGGQGNSGFVIPTVHPPRN